MYYYFFKFTTLVVILQRMDLGECPKIHDLALRADYANACKERDYFYDIDVSIEKIMLLILRYRSSLTWRLFRFILRQRNIYKHLSRIAIAAPS